MREGIWFCKHTKKAGNETFCFFYTRGRVGHQSTISSHGARRRRRALGLRARSGAAACTATASFLAAGAPIPTPHTNAATARSSSVTQNTAAADSSCRVLSSVAPSMCGFNSSTPAPATPAPAAEARSLEARVGL